MSIHFSHNLFRADMLGQEERTALWALRCLLGPRHWKTSVALKKLLGLEAERLQERFKSVFLHTVCATSSLEFSSTEAHLLHVLADMQNQTDKDVFASELGDALMQLGLTLAAYGYWLPVKKKQSAERMTLPQPTCLQDNHPTLMQAAE